MKLKNKYSDLRAQVDQQRQNIFCIFKKKINIPITTRKFRHNIEESEKENFWKDFRSNSLRTMLNLKIFFVPKLRSWRYREGTWWSLKSHGFNFETPKPKFIICILNSRHAIRQLLKRRGVGCEF